MRGRSLRSGQDLVEYALLVVFTLMALLMIFDLGRVTYTYSVLFNAAREGARYSVTKTSLDVKIVSTRNDLITTYIRSRVPGLEENDITVNIQWIAVTDEPDRVVITLTYPFDPITPFISALLGADPFTIGARSTMNLEY